MQVGDTVKLNDRYYNEGRRYFGKNLAYPNNFEKKVIKLYDSSTDSSGNILPAVAILEDDISISTIFLEVVKEAN